MPKVLIVDDDPSFCLMLKKFLEKNGYDAKEVLTAKSCLQLLITDGDFDIILIDFRLPDLNGLELLKEIKKKKPQVPVILMTSYANIRTAVKAMQMGAFEYVTKPINPDEILISIREALETGTEEVAEPAKAGKAKDTNTSKRPPLPKFQFIEGNSSEALEIKKYIDLVAPTNLSVIIHGESGTGKEYVSRMIHQHSRRSDKPFVAIDCGALSEELAASELFGHLKGSFTGAINDKIGQFQAANGGTLFLDEIGNLSYEIQVKLLRAIQEGMVRRIGSNKDDAVDVRIIAATNEDLSEAAKRGDFREDLYHRLNEFMVIVSPLRKRKDDIGLFAKHFLERSNMELEKDVKGFDFEVMQKFLGYTWPGNLREFKNVIRRAVLLTQGDLVMLESLPAEIINPPAESVASAPEQETAVPSANSGTNLKEMIERNERETIVRTLEQVKYNKSKAARLLNIDRKTLYNKLKQYGIDA
ncbi:sigma-54 dependent transcriptional regulator [Flammeovirgaceae bacterium SG7u.111]|nr:sigma-54 dependent transcriptional regulator [Flammeovirgaceae bacterium SG7u.132]WPO36252.1 sigma-54 dependent transcriptional regulator [Flammeovirgaceae bacterium SG7u.111]